MLIKKIILHHPFLAAIIITVIVAVTAAQAQNLLTPQATSSPAIAGTSSAIISGGIGTIVLPPPKPLPAAVNGTLLLTNKTPTNEVAPLPLQNIRLPETHIYLVNSSNVIVDSDNTQLDGKFDLVAPDKGSYQLCWEVKYLTHGCKPWFNVSGGTVYLHNVYVQATTDNYVFGISKLKDGNPCWLNDPFFGVNLYTGIDLIDTAGLVVKGSRVKANVAGEYVIGLPGGAYRVRASCEKTQYITRTYFTTGVSQANLPLNNTPPKSIAMAAYNTVGKGILRANTGVMINSRFTAVDNDADTLSFSWKTLGGSGNVPNLNADNQDWTLPSSEGSHQLYVMAKDGKGGYAFDRLNIVAGPPVIYFSGVVIDEVTRKPIANAQVSVTGKHTKTNAQGWFKLDVPELPGDQRYPLNISHFNYATYSRILDKSSRGNTYEMIRAQVSYHDPNLPIDVVDERSSGPCGAGNTNTTNTTGNKAAEPTKCQSRGAHLQLPAGSLVYADQSPAKGPISLSMATLNPARRALPGDYRGIDSNKDNMELESFGALYATFRDVNGDIINLKKGSKALLEIPISNDQLAVANNTIPMWTYDEKSGFWLEEQKASKVLTAGGWVYKGTTTHFSTINMDIAGNDPTHATCVRLQLGSSLSSWSNLVLRAYVTAAGSTAPKVKETALDSDLYHAIYRIPYSNPAAGNTLRLELRGTLPSGNQVVLLNNIINTDLRPKMTGTDLWPAYPYDECGDPIVLEADPVTLPYYGDIDATGRPAFLTGPYGQYLPENAELSANDYYAAIDPANSKATLGNWWVENGFGADGSGGTRASYLNHNDLGFGRDMHCTGTAADYACYVTNYGLPDQNLDNADDALAQNPATQGATVTMEYHASEGNNAVSFYAYGGGVGAAPRINFADLDGLGPKPIPHLCMVCHGSDTSVLDSGHKVVGAKFREFDLQSFRYSGHRSWDYGQATLTPAEFSAFHTLNSGVEAINSGNKIADLINAWYPGAGDIPNVPANPPGWTPGAPTPFETQSYQEVYGKTCRTCHIARGYPETYGQLSSSFSESLVCGHPRTMPNSYITYKNFWSDLARVDLFETMVSNFNCGQ